MRILLLASFERARPDSQGKTCPGKDLARDVLALTLFVSREGALLLPRAYYEPSSNSYLLLVSVLSVRVFVGAPWVICLFPYSRRLTGPPRSVPPHAPQRSR